MAGGGRIGAEFLSAAGDLLLGARCHGCGSPGLGTCRPCRARLAGHRVFTTRPDPTPDGFPLCVSTAPYDDQLSRLIVAHKERQALALTALLGDRLALGIRALLRIRPSHGSPVLIVPVPSAARAVRDRGFDATAALARRAVRSAQGSDGPRLRVRTALVQARGVADQGDLDAAERATNLRGRLRLRDEIRGVDMIVVDDLVTTGASLTEAARVLAAGGGRVLGAATVAATRRRRVRMPGAY